MSGKPYALSIKVVIRDRDGRCLLLQRSHNSKGNPGRWEFPGGKVDPGEEFDAALLREVREETGLTISLQRVAGAAESESPAKRVAYLIMEGRLEAGEVCLSEEHEDFTWAAPAELPGLDLSEQFRAFARSYAEEHEQQ